MFLESVALLAIIAFLFYKWAKVRGSYFVDRNVKYDKFIPLLGSFKDLFLRKTSFSDMIIAIHKKFDGEQ